MCSGKGLLTEAGHPARPVCPYTLKMREASIIVVKALARASGGALLFSLPLLMTMEMWEFGSYLNGLRLAVLLAVTVVVLAALSYHIGFEETFNWLDDIRDGLAAFAVGFVVAAAALWIFGVINARTTFDEAVGRIALQAVPASIGASLARAQFGQVKEQDARRSGFATEMFHMSVGALFFAMNLAPTEEMVLISYMMTSWHAIALIVISLLVLHVFVYAVEFHGQSPKPEDTHFIWVFMRYTLGGYTLAFLVSAAILWSFGRFEGSGFIAGLMSTIVLAFPAAVGAAAARLLL